LPEGRAKKERSKTKKDSHTEKRYPQVNTFSPEASGFENQESHSGVPKEIAEPVNPSEHREPQEPENFCVQN
jgi:hypothetical protein